MSTRITTVALLMAVVLGSAAARAETGRRGVEELAQALLQQDPAELWDVIYDLREAGPAGMDALLARIDSCTGESCAGGKEVLDQVCGVRDCADIRLFWYTELEAAEAAAAASGKPILSLRLMGRLDEELSCANSRFFRTAFYKNREINQLLRDRFILHWRSVRPVPKVTIDFGAGVKLERTLTGNSIHYVLDSRGRLLDALPGLYGPQTFKSALEQAADAARQAVRLDDEQLVQWATARHREQLASLQKTFRGEASRAAIRELAASKSAVERPILAALDSVSDDAVSDDTLRGVARILRPNVHLDADSRAFMLSKQGVTDPQAAQSLVESFEMTMAADEAINTYRLGPRILRKLSDPAFRKALQLEAFNQWVYEEVFRTPLSDPWLGLAPADVYTALPQPIDDSPGSTF